MLNTANHQKNANQKTTRYYSGLVYWSWSRKQKITNIDKNKVISEPLCTVGRNVNGSHCGKSSGVSQKLKTGLP